MRVKVKYEKREKHEIRGKNEVDLKWVVKNWKKIREKVPRATIYMLARQVGLFKVVENFGVVFYDKETFKLLDPALLTGDVEWVEKFIKWYKNKDKKS